MVTLVILLRSHGSHIKVVPLWSIEMMKLERRPYDGGILHVATNNLTKLDDGRQTLETLVKKHVGLVYLLHELTMGGRILVSAICPRTDE